MSRDRTAIDCNKGFPVPATDLMNRLSDQFLAGSAFSGKQYRNICDGDFIQLLVKPFHCEGRPVQHAKALKRFIECHFEPLIQQVGAMQTLSHLMTHYVKVSAY